MAVLVKWRVPQATAEQLFEVEKLTQARGEAAGGPPYQGCMFLAVTEGQAAFDFVSAWRTEADFRNVLEAMLGPDLATVDLGVADIEVSPVFAMAIPGGHG